MLGRAMLINDASLLEHEETPSHVKATELSIYCNAESVVNNTLGKPPNHYITE
jgi:hypothetical protein